jgi:hypothetical protein
MDAGDFVEAVHKAVYHTAINGVLRVLKEPPGRRPRGRLVVASRWFNSLTEDQRTQVEEVVRLSVDHAVFGLLACLDGAQALKRGGAQVELTVDGDAVSQRHDLHSQFRSLVDAELE